MVRCVRGRIECDAVGEVWYDKQLYNGYDPTTTIGGLQKCSIEPIANHGVVGRGILLDIARLKGKPHLDAGEPITIADLEAAAERQKCTIEKHDTLGIRPGWLSRFYDHAFAGIFPKGSVREP